MKSTIKDVAKQAGVSMKTVSRVLNNEPNVAKSTREKVLKIAEDLSYTPNFSARGLASSKSYLLALIYDNPNPDYVMQMQSGAIDICRQYGYHLVMEPLEMPVSIADPDFAATLERNFQRLAIDGVILTPPISDSLIVLNVLTKLGIKYVRVGTNQAIRSLPVGPMVSLDNHQAAYDMTQALIDSGHKDIGFIQGLETHRSAILRYEGFMAAMQKHGYDVPRSRVFRGDYTFNSGIAGANAFLTNERRSPSAIFASNDDMAAGVVSVANRLGINVPSELSVCGFDDTPIARKMSPQLSSVRQPIYDIGQVAAKMLLQPHNEDEAPLMSVCVDYELVFRGSTGRHIF